MRIIQLDITGSTNSDARKLAEQADFGPLWVIANQQNQGRGRRGREWISPKGNFYGSYLFPTDLTPQQRSQYSFVFALAIYDGLKALITDGQFDLKWPNDILLDEGKVSGLLLETGQTHHQAWIIVGIGVNIVSSPKGTPYQATHLSKYSDESIDPIKVQQYLQEQIDHWTSIFETSGFESIRHAWLDRAVNIPGPVTVRLPDETFEGIAEDLKSNGALQVRLANGTIRQIHAGDVFPG